MPEKINGFGLGSIYNPRNKDKLDQEKEKAGLRKAIVQKRVEYYLKYPGIGSHIRAIVA